MSVTFSILIITYHPVWGKLKLTLDSVMEQGYKDYEVVVTDDGSPEPFTEKLHAYFKSKGFCNYKLCHSEENQGTVKNLLNGLKECKGKYVRDFGAGDLFYSPDTLEKLALYMESGDYDYVAGIPRAFSVDEKGVKAVTFNHPFDMNAYRYGKKNRIKANVMLYSDIFPGSTVCYRKDFFQKKMEEFSGDVIYAEDLCQIPAIMEEAWFGFFDEYLVWYELGDGTSTKKKSDFSKALAKDVEAVFEREFQKYPEDQNLKKRKKFMKYYKIENLYLRTLARFFANPGMVIYFIRHFWQVLSKQFQPRHVGMKDICSKVQSGATPFLRDKSFVKQERNAWK